MGEYAKFAGESVKIGTCENMYYLRADQAAVVAPEANSLDPIREADAIRFRFPFPDEDSIAPGAFEDYDRSIRVDGFEAPEGVDHGHVQFVANQQGYNVCLPCPEGTVPAPEGVKIHRNGWNGGPGLVQQRVWNGHLAAVMVCRSCGARYRLPELADAEPLIVALRSMADREQRDADMQAARSGQEPWTASHATFLHKIATRVERGYTAPLPWASLASTT